MKQINQFAEELIYSILYNDVFCYMIVIIKIIINVHILLWAQFPDCSYWLFFPSLPAWKQSVWSS